MPACSGWRNFEDFKDRIIDRSQDARARVPQHRRQRHARRQVRAGPRRHGSQADGRDGAEAQGHHRRHQERALSPARNGRRYEHAVEAGTIANIPVMVDFGNNHPERPLDDLLTKIAAPRRHLHALLFRTARRAGSDDGKPNPAMIEGREARRHLRCRTRRRQLRLARRRAR